MCLGFFVDNRYISVATLGDVMIRVKIIVHPVSHVCEVSDDETISNTMFSLLTRLDVALSKSSYLFIKKGICTYLFVLDYVS